MRWNSWLRYLTSARHHRWLARSRYVGLAVPLLLLLAQWFPAAAFADSPTPSPTAPTAPTLTANQLTSLFDRGLIFAGALVVLLVGVLVIDIIYAYTKLSPAVVKVLGDSAPNAAPADVKTMIAAVYSSPKGMKGLGRMVLSLMIAAVLAALTLLLVVDGQEASGVVTTVVGALAGGLTSIVGFYFGSKTTDSS